MPRTRKVDVHLHQIESGWWDTVKNLAPVVAVGTLAIGGWLVVQKINSLTAQVNALSGQVNTCSLNLAELQQIVNSVSLVAQNALSNTTQIMNLIVRAGLN